MQIVEEKKYTSSTLLRNPLIYKTDKGNVIKKTDLEFILAYKNIKQFGFASYGGIIIESLLPYINRRIPTYNDDFNNSLQLVRSINNRCIRNGLDLIEELSVVSGSQHAKYFNRVIRKLRERVMK